MTVKFNHVDDIITRYFQSYRTDYTHGYRQTDMPQRAYNYSRIRAVLSKIENHLDNTYIRNGKNYIKIDNIATVEYEIFQAKGLVAVKNIYFNGFSNQSSTTIRQPNNIQQPQPNRQQQQIQYKPISKECYGLTMVKSTNGLFNYVNKNNQIFYPLRWFKNAEDFKEWDNGVIAARVFDGIDRYFLTLENPMLHPIGKGDYLTDTYHIVLGKILQEQMFYRNRDKFQNVLERFNFTLNYDPAVGGQLPQKWDF